MPKLRICLSLICVCLTLGCSPRDFLTRRLAGALIAGSETFKAPQQFWLRTGVVSAKDYSSPEYLVLQNHGWITGVNVPCTPAPSRTGGASASACWDVALTPLGVDAFRDLLPSNAPASQYFGVPVARRELLGISGIAKDGNVAEVDFTWKWTPMNEIGAALFAAGVKYNSAVEFKHYDDGWQVGEAYLPPRGLTLDDALRNAQPVQ
jgi:hypothetical protein